MSLLQLPEFCYACCLLALPVAQFAMKIVKISAALKRLKKISDEIRYLSCFEQKQFTGGLIAFKPAKKRIQSRSATTIKTSFARYYRAPAGCELTGRRIRLVPGTLCHIPKRTPHDFAAARSGELVLFYLLIKT